MWIILVNGVMEEGYTVSEEARFNYWLWKETNAQVAIQYWRCYHG